MIEGSLHRGATWDFVDEPQTCSQAGCPYTTPCPDHDVRKCDEPMPAEFELDDHDWGDNAVAPFNFQVREVWELSDLIDNFDLVSADRSSCVQFRALQRLYVANALRLVELIEERGEDIRQQLKALLRGS